MANSIKSTTPTLKDAAALSQMLVHVAKQDQHYTGDKALTLSETKGGLLVTEHGTVVGDDSCARYYHQGAVMELVPGLTPVMKPDDYVDAGSAITEILQPGQSDEKAWLQSGFCAVLVLFYDDPENPRLEAMNRHQLLDKLADLKKKNLTPADEHFTPVVNISRDADVSDKYTTALYFTTKEYTYFIYAVKTDLILKKYKTGDTDPSADPRNNKQFFDKEEHNCYDCPTTAVKNTVFSQNGSSLNTSTSQQ